jgi:hypothetical protein
VSDLELVLVGHTVVLGLANPDHDVIWFLLRCWIWIEYSAGGAVVCWWCVSLWALLLVSTLVKVRIVIGRAVVYSIADHGCTRILVDISMEIWAIVARWVDRISDRFVIGGRTIIWTWSVFGCLGRGIRLVAASQRGTKMLATDIIWQWPQYDLVKCISLTKLGKFNNLIFV